MDTKIAVCVAGAVLALAMTSAFATDNCRGNCGGGSGGSSSSATGVGVGIGVGIGMGGSAKAGAEANSLNIVSPKQSQEQQSYNINTPVQQQGNEQRLTINNPAPLTYQTTEQRIVNVPDAPAVISHPTAPCRVSLGLSGSFLGGSIGGTGSVLDEGCDAREDARLLVNMGLRAEAEKRLCAKPEMAAALGTKCPKPVAQQGSQYDDPFIARRVASSAK